MSRTAILMTVALTACLPHERFNHISTADTQDGIVIDCDWHSIESRECFELQDQFCPVGFTLVSKVEYTHTDQPWQTRTTHIRYTIMCDNRHLPIKPD